MKKLFREFLFFSRRERQGIIVLVTSIILVFLSGQLYLFWLNRQEPSEEEIRQQAIAVQEYDKFIASVREREKKTFTYSQQSKKQQSSVILAPFNPNTADSATFCQLGLPSWMARNILHYREKGGRFRKPEDFRKVYGLTEEQYQRLAPYISIAPQDTARRMASLYLPQIPKDSIYKYPTGTIINLNSADTTELKKIPGIGSGIARQIVGYRQRLGGFYRIEQLEEINLDYRQIEDWFKIRPEEIQRINLNRASVDRLRNHPYINFYQAKVFVEHRKKKGALHSLKQFALYEEFKADDLEKIRHYVCFE